MRLLIPSFKKMHDLQKKIESIQKQLVEKLDEDGTYHHVTPKFIEFIVKIIVERDIAVEALESAQEFVTDPDSESVNVMTSGYRIPLTAEQRAGEEIKRIRRLKNAAKLIHEALSLIKSLPSSC